MKDLISIDEFYAPKARQIYSLIEDIKKSINVMSVDCVIQDTKNVYCERTKLRKTKYNDCFITIKYIENVVIEKSSFVDVDNLIGYVPQKEIILNFNLGTYPFNIIQSIDFIDSSLDVFVGDAVLELIGNMNEKHIQLDADYDTNNILEYLKYFIADCTKLNK